VSGWTDIYDPTRYHAIYDDAYRATTRIERYVDLDLAESAARDEWRFFLLGRRAASKGTQRSALDLLAPALAIRRAVLDHARAIAELEVVV
jgi:hypothetical protein